MCSCGYVKEEYTFKAIVDDSSKGIKPINTGMVYALRACGLGHAGLEKFTCIMKMPKPMFDNISNKIRDSAKFIADLSMNNAANEMRKGSSHYVYLGFTVDGKWRRRGYTSMNGIVAISVDSGNVLDVEPMSANHVPV